MRGGREGRSQGGRSQGGRSQGGRQNGSRGRQGQQSDQSGRNQDQAYKLASLGDEIAGPIQKSFSCQGKDYGYYADTSNGCKVFHVCAPQQKRHFSFFCNEGTIFDQEAQTCMRKGKAKCAG
jgi:hypothetical protein